MYYLLMAILALFVVFAFFAGIVLFTEWITDRAKPTIYELWLINYNKYR